MWSRSQLKENGTQMFRRNYWACVGAAFLMGLFSVAGGSQGTNISQTLDHNNGSYGGYGYMNTVIMTTVVITVLVISLLVMVLKVFVGNLLEVGGTSFFIKNRTERPGVGEVLSSFKSGHYGNIVLTLFLRDLFIALWTLLFIVPGIIKSLEYLMVPYILAENPAMDRKEAFAISKRMMDGQKWDVFVLGLSFIGWELLSAVTCGIVGIFYVNPYIKATYAELYTFNKIKAYNEGYIR